MEQLIQEKINDLCVRGNIGQVKKLFEENSNIITPEFIEEIFNEMCEYNYSTFPFETFEFLYKLNQNIDIESNFKGVCFNNDLEVAQYLFILKPDIDITNGDYDDVFIHLKIIRWLHRKIPDMDISFYESRFIYGCENGDIELVEWLIDVKPTIDISANNDYAFRRACEYRHIEIAKLLLEFKPTIQLPVIMSGFEDVRVRLLSYYVSTWHNDNNTGKMDKYKLSNLFFWIISKKPTLEELFKCEYYHCIIYCLEKFGAKEGDAMGAIGLEDIRMRLEHGEIEETEVL